MVFVALGWVTISVGVLLWLASVLRGGQMRSTPVPDIIPALIAAAIVAAIALQLPMRLAFEISQPALDRLVAEAALQDGVVQLRPQQLGLYYASVVDAYPGGVRFLIEGSGLLDPSGFAFFGGGAPPYEPSQEYVPFDGSWRVWIHSWSCAASSPNVSYDRAGRTSVWNGWTLTGGSLAQELTGSPRS